MMTSKTFQLSMLGALAALSLARPAFSHGLRTAYLEIAERQPGRAMITLRQTVRDAALKPVLPPDCDVREIPGGRASGKVYQADCPRGLAGVTVEIEGMGTLTTETAVRYQGPADEQGSKLLTPASPAWTLPRTGSAWDTISSYVRLGVTHILGGADHLLFLLALLFLARTPRSLFWTSTAFTGAHSITLSLTALDLLRLSSQAAEAAIALSLILVALDIPSRGKSPEASHGPKLAFLFGLVHGLGFAGALGEIGLPQSHLALSLFSFNAGVELGQVAFLAAGWLVLVVISRWRWSAVAPALGAYVVGVPGVYWLLERSSHWFF